MDVSLSYPFIVVGIAIIFATTAIVSKYREVKRRNASEFYSTYIASCNSFMHEHHSAVRHAGEIGDILDNPSMSDGKKLAQIGDCTDLTKANEAIPVFLEATDLHKKNYHQYSAWMYRKARDHQTYWWNTGILIRGKLKSIERLKRRHCV